MTQIDDPLYNEQEAAEYLGLKNGNSLAKWRIFKSEPLNYIMVGTSVRYRRSALDAYLALKGVNGLEGPPASMRRRKGGSGRPLGGRKRRTARRKGRAA